MRSAGVTEVLEYSVCAAVVPVLASVVPCCLLRAREVLRGAGIAEALKTGALLSLGGW